MWQGKMLDLYLELLMKELEAISKMACHSEGAFVATEESRISGIEILRFAQDDIFEIACNINLNQSQDFVFSSFPIVRKLKKRT
jgi:hypothetical protein